MSEIKNVYETVNISMVRGDTLQFNMTFENLSESLTSAKFTAKNRASDQALFQKTLNNGITLVEDGVYRVRVAPEDTAGVAPGKYNYDLEIGVDEDTYTLLTGTLSLLKDYS